MAQAGTDKRIPGESFGARLQAERLVDDMPALLLAAEHIAETVMLGAHGRRRKGTGTSFWQFRGYEPGDMVQAIDWRQSAKRGQVHIREYEWEAAQTVWLWCDFSASMRYRSQGRGLQKVDCARLLLLALAILLLRSDEQVGLASGQHRPLRGRRAIDLLWQQLGGLEQAPRPAAIPAHARLSGFSNLVLFSDFLTPLDGLAKALSGYAEQGIRGLLCHIVDPAEEDFPFQGRIRFDGSEGEDSLVFGRADALRDRYRRRFAEWRAELTQLAAGYGWQILYHRTDRAPEIAMMALHRALAERWDQA